MSDPDAQATETAESAGGLDPRTRTAIVGVAAMGGLFAVGGGVGFGLRVGISVAVGALIAVGNLYGLARIVGALLGSRAEGDPGSGMWGVLAVVKILGLFGGVWLLLGAHLVEPIGLVVGWGALPVGVTLATFFSDKTDRPVAPRAKEAPPAGPSAT
jgi:hypothetical protein